jgi:asparaginyl-tRNA synthetase
LSTQYLTSSPSAGADYSANRFLHILEDPFYALLVKVQDIFHGATTRFWSTRGVRCLHLPITTGSVSSPMGRGSDSHPVLATIFGTDSYLADSMQFMLEYGCRLNPAGTWYLMPSFRGEPADATHLNQFFHSEAELPGDLDAVIATVEDYLTALAHEVLAELSHDIVATGRSIEHVAALADLRRFPRMTMAEAVAFLGDDGLSLQVAADGAPTLTRHGERRLLAEVSPLLWVTHHHHDTVPFYQAYAEDTRFACSADLLMGVGETVGAGQRHRTGEQVTGALRHHEVDEDAYSWYVRMKDAYPMLTSGFGLGVERWLMWLLDVADIRDLQLVMREWGRDIVP